MPSVEHTRAILADAIYQPPVVFMGLTSNEMVATGAAAASIGVLLALIAGLAAGHIVVAVMVFIVSCVVAYLSIAARVRFYATNRPTHYLKARIHCWRATTGLGGSPLIQRSGGWSRGRSIHGTSHGTP